MIKKVATNIYASMLKEHVGSNKLYKDLKSWHCLVKLQTSRVLYIMGYFIMTEVKISDCNEV